MSDDMLVDISLAIEKRVKRQQDEPEPNYLVSPGIYML